LCRPSDTNPEYMGCACTRPDGLALRVVGQVDAEFVVDCSLVLGTCLSECGDDVFELADEGFDFVRGELARRWFAAQVAFEALALAFDLGDP
jgi:hypothetical protein